MKSLKIVASVVFALCLSFNFMLAQVKGNKKLKTNTIMLDQVEELNIDFPVTLVLDNSLGEGLKMSTDENIFEYIGVKQSGNRLNITQEEWIAPSQTVKIEGSLPVLKNLQMGGYGTANIKNLSTKQFKLKAKVATLNLQGKVNSFYVNTGTGKIDAQNLEAERVNAKITSFGQIKVFATQSLIANAQEGGLILYKGNPTEIDKSQKLEAKILRMEDYVEADLPPVEYVSIKLKNNKNQKIDTYVRGPVQKRFSYGIPFKAQQSRKEEWPIGTKLFLVSKLGTRKLLHTVSAQDENKVVELF